MTGRQSKQEPATVHAENVAPTPLPILELTERVCSFDQMGLTTGRFGYRQWSYDNTFLGVRRGDVIKIDLWVPPKGIRGEIVWAEIHGNNIETMGALEAWSKSVLAFWEEPNTCMQGSMKYCLPRKVLGKLQLDPSQRLFLMRRYADTGNLTDWRGQQRLREVLKPRLFDMKDDQSAKPSFITWLLAQPKRGRLLNLRFKMKAEIRRSLGCAQRRDRNSQSSSD